MNARVDHLVIAARSLDEGVRWCRTTLGIEPGPGGAHPLMGTHNRLIKVATADFPRAYLEIIAIDPKARPARTVDARRWFDLDDALLQAALARGGPRLIHFVAEVPDAAAAVQALAHVRIDRGQVLEASRDTPAGRLSWQITVRDDGQRLFYGALPTLIEWGPVHPTDSMGDSGITLRSLDLAHPRKTDLEVALQAIGLAGVSLATGAPRLRAVFDTPRGTVTLESGGI
ncbi:VOC family protein [Variovorax sp. J22R24]|uniref:VOC family protein n=1 Tax=Variovorax gracilis TaxID=3053502 RepID=UPI002576A334|nr:VOC family protein [Variovorax sp. J22R24]MDM0108626.1 VOC family protein [Variovorax sp. J22R24]